MTQGGRKAAQDIEDDEIVPLTEAQIAWLKKWHAATGRDGAVFETLNDLAIDVRDHRGECRGLLMQVEALAAALARQQQEQETAGVLVEDVYEAEEGEE